MIHPDDLHAAARQLLLVASAEPATLSDLFTRARRRFTDRRTFARQVYSVHALALIRAGLLRDTRVGHRHELSVTPAGEKVADEVYAYFSYEVVAHVD